MRAFFGGIGFVLGKPATWGWAIVPVVVLVVLATAFCTLGVLGANHLAASLVPGTNDWDDATRVALGGVLSIVTVVMGLVVAVSLTQPISGFALEAIVRRQDAELGLPPWPALPLAKSMAHTLGATMVGLGAWLVLFCGLSVVGFFVPPMLVVTIPLKFLVSALLVAWDLLDYPFGLRGMGLGARFAFVARNFGAVLSFGVLGALVMLTPGAGLLLLPFGAAGAARLVAARDATSSVLI